MAAAYTEQTGIENPIEKIEMIKIGTKVENKGTAGS
jgi:hypothetical protein